MNELQKILSPEAVLVIAALASVITFLWGMLLLLVVQFVRKCMANIDELNKSSTSLATKLGQVDTKVDIIHDRVRIIGERTHGLVQDVGILKGKMG